MEKKNRFEEKGKIEGALVTHQQEGPDVGDLV